MEKTENNLSFTDFCKGIGIKRNVFIEFLIKNKYIYIQYYGKNKERHKNIAFPKYDTKNGLGLFEMNQKPNLYNKNKNNINIQITPTGQEYFIQMLTKERFINGNTKY